MDWIRLLIVDDHPLFRHGIRCILESAPDIQVLGEAEDFSSAVLEAKKCQPNVILLDMQMPGSSGGVVVQRLKQIVPEAKIIVLTAFEDEEYLFGALRAGADAYLLKSVPLQNLACTIRAVYRGEQLVSPDLMGKVLGKFKSISKEMARHESGISDFELRVLQLMATGASNKQIAEALFMSDSTIKRKIQDLYQKLDATDRLQAITAAINLGLV
jgi:DNA-binding NarL/FixJ family response regulator